MFNKIKIKPIINKRNGQINCSLPKKKISKELLKSIFAGKKIKISMEEFE